MIKIDYDKCCFKNGQCSSCSCGGACIGCAEACAAGAITREKTVKVNNELCLSCGACVDACKYGAISMI